MYPSLHPTTSVFLKIIEGRVTRGVKWGIEKMFSKILNPMYQSMPLGNLSEFASYYTSVPENYRRSEKLGE